MLGGMALMYARNKWSYSELTIHLDIPHEDFNNRWREQRDRDMLTCIRDNAHTTVLYDTSMSFNDNYKWMLQHRNQHMVDNTTITCGVWDGRISRSGTYNCLMYAKKKGRQICCINPLHIDPNTGYCEEAWNQFQKE